MKLSRVLRCVAVIVVVLSSTVGLQVGATKPVMASSWSISLTADPSSATVGRSVYLNAHASQDVAFTAYTIFIYNHTRGELLATCNFGEWCSAWTTESLPSNQTYIAYVAEITAAMGYPPSNIQATSNVVGVEWVAPTNAGVGAFAADASYGAGLPVASGSCTSSSFSMTGSATAGVIDTRWGEVVGAVSITASNEGTPCEGDLGGSRWVAITVAGIGATGGWFSCPLSGYFFRNGAMMTWSANGFCTINGQPSRNVFLSGRSTWVPTNPGALVTAPVTSAAIEGVFWITPWFT